MLERRCGICIRGAAQLRQPAPADLARRYAELLAENLGQPGFRELVIAVHDLDARRDLIFALVAEPRRRDLVRRATTADAEARRAEVVDLAGVGRDHLADAIAAALSVPVVTEPHAMTFAPDAYWRGETHRLCDRPGSLVAAARGAGRPGRRAGHPGRRPSPELAGPHALAARAARRPGRVGEYLQSIGGGGRPRCAAVSRRDACRAIFTIRPGHNPIGPFDFGGEYDDRSDRRQPLAELIELAGTRTPIISSSSRWSARAASGSDRP